MKYLKKQVKEAVIIVIQSDRWTRLKFIRCSEFRLPLYHSISLQMSIEMVRAVDLIVIGDYVDETIKLR